MARPKFPTSHCCAASTTHWKVHEGGWQLARSADDQRWLAVRPLHEHLPPARAPDVTRQTAPPGAGHYIHAPELRGPRVVAADAAAGDWLSSYAPDKEHTVWRLEDVGLGKPSRAGDAVVLSEQLGLERSRKRLPDLTGKADAFYLHCCSKRQRASPDTFPS